MQNRISAVVAATVMAAGGVLITAPAATAADTPTCVSKTEYRAVSRGMTRERVHRIFDRSGTQDSHFSMGGDRYETRSYKPCSDPRWGTVWIDYKNGKLTDKMAIW